MSFAPPHRGEMAEACGLRIAGLAGRSKVFELVDGEDALPLFGLVGVSMRAIGEAVRYLGRTSSRRLASRLRVPALAGRTQELIGNDDIGYRVQPSLICVGDLASG